MVLHAVFRIDAILQGLLGNMMAAQFLVDSASCLSSRVHGPFYETPLASSVSASACPVTFIVDGGIALKVLISEAERVTVCEYCT
jgi:hypothetical protein